MKKVLKKLYGLIPFKKQIFQTVKKIWIPPVSVYKHLYFKGIIKVDIEAGKEFRMMHYGYTLENDLFWAGLNCDWERYSIRTWIELSKNARVIFDVGANTGLYSIAAKAVNKDAEVYAFEPVERVYNKLKINSALNKDDIHCINMAISNSNGYANLYDVDQEHEYAATLNKSSEFITVEKVSQVETITLDAFIQQHHIPGIDLMKIDVETFEPQVLEGFSEYLKLYRPAIIIEILTDEIGEKVTKLTSGLGYQYFEINERKGLIRSEMLRRGEGLNFLICQMGTARTLAIGY